MNAKSRNRKELHKQFGIAIGKNPETLKQIENLYTNLDLEGMTLEENVQRFSKKLGMPYDYLLRYITRRISEEIKERLREKGKEIHIVRNEFCRNGKRFEDNISSLANELGVPQELMVLSSRRFGEISVVASRLYENKVDCHTLFAGKKASHKKEVERVAQDINVSPASIEKFLKCLL